MPLVSVIILVWNDTRFLMQCLEALRRQTFHDMEVILIDNGSVDTSYLSGLKEQFSFLIIRCLEKNLGFASGNNQGALLARGKWLVLLNNDAIPEPGWLKGLLEAADEEPRHNFFASRQIQYRQPHLFDGAGDAYHLSGLAWRRYYNRFVDSCGLIQEEVFGACAAAAMYRREDFLKVGGFDEDYFSYFEDVDLSFRLRLAGGRCLYVPSAIVHHVGSSSTGKLSDFVVYHGHRNLVWTYLKNMPTVLFWLFLPLHLLANLFFVVAFIFKGKSRTILRAKRDAVLGISTTLRKRRKVQAMRVVSSWDVISFMSKGILEPYWAFRERTRQDGSN